jgi:hypothetical protein
MMGHSFAGKALLSALNLAEGPLPEYERKHAFAIMSLLRTAQGHVERDPNFLAVHLRVSMWDEQFDLGEGRSISVSSCALNTLLATGSDPMKLAARLHGQCELHCWVDGRNRHWLADIMAEGRASGIFRANAGWEETIRLLKGRDTEPVVTSYSVGDGFPNAGLAVDAGMWSPPGDPDDEERDWDAWYDLPPDEQWEVCMKALRKTAGGLELRPDHWTYPAYHFVSPITAFHVAEVAYKVAT